jgi:hypothetical protein
MAVLRTLGIGVAVALVAGLVTGLVARLAMRVAAVATGGPTAFSLGATAGIVLFFCVAALPGALVAAGTPHRARWLAAVALPALLTVPAIGIATEDIPYLELLIPMRATVVIAAAAVVFLAIALLPVLVVRLAERWRRVPLSPARGREAA